MNILETGLALYNKYGVPHVSQRKITEALEISPGNLTYHFKKKEDIYETLYFEFMLLVQKKVSHFLKQDIHLRSFADLIEDWFKDMYRYRFIFIDLSTLIRTNPKIKENYRQMVEVRQSVFLKILSDLVADQVMKPEEIDGQYELLYQRLHIVSDFYLSSIESGKGETHFDYLEHKLLFFSSLFPFLTEKGKQEYRIIFDISKES